MLMSLQKINELLKWTVSVRDKLIEFASGLGKARGMRTASMFGPHAPHNFNLKVCLTRRVSAGRKVEGFYLRLDIRCSQLADFAYASSISDKQWLRGNTIPRQHSATQGSDHGSTPAPLPCLGNRFSGMS